MGGLAAPATALYGGAAALPMPLLAFAVVSLVSAGMARRYGLERPGQDG